MGKKSFVDAVKAKGAEIIELVEREVPDVSEEVKKELVKKLVEEKKSDDTGAGNEDGSEIDTNRERIEKIIVDAGNKRALEIVKSQSKLSAGPCMSTIYDPVLNKIHYGLNYKSKNKLALKEYVDWIHNGIDPILKARLEEYQKDIEDGKVTDLPDNHDPRLAAHSEVKALDEVIKARREAGMDVDDNTISELYLYNIDLTKLYKENKIVPKDRCVNCKILTKGIVSVNHQ